MQSSSSIAGPTYLLVTIATLMFQINLYDRQGPSPHEWIQLAFVLAVAFMMRQKSRARGKSMGRSISVLGFSALIIAPVIFDTFGRTTGHFGHPFEVQVSLCLRNMMIGLAIGVDDNRSKMFASLASCFLALFSLLWLMNYWTTALLIVYTLTGMWWLLGAYWDRLSHCFLTQSERVIPWKPALCAAAFAGVIALLMIPLATNEYFTTAIQGFLPSSGGTGAQDEYAYGGVGDGPQMVSAKEDASSFGPIESELFLESKMPSLYDAINEFSDPPPNPKKRARLKAIPLAPSQVKENHQRRGTTQKASREFSAVRNRRKETPSVKDLRSKALLQVAGRVPVHLRLYAYDMWDGHKLTSSKSAEPLPMRLESDDSDGKNWVRYVGVPTDNVMSYKERHELRIINLKSDRVPAPPNLLGVHIDRVHTRHFFDTTQDGMLGMDVEFIPQLTVLHLESLRRWSSQVPLLEEQPENTESSERAIARLAHEWTEGVSEGWPQIDAISNRLRQEYALDPEELVSQDVDDAAKHFLFESKRGPDYLFATSAALLIQSLGYDTRVVSGFYADPENYNRQSRVTSIYADDAHFWVEVLAAPVAADSMDNGPVLDRWLTVDPSPGYQVLLAPDTIWSQLFHRAALTWNVLRRNPFAAMTLVAVVIIMWKKRADVFDLAITSWWRLHHNWGGVRHQVISTVRLLERRARVRGCPRPSGLSLSKWKLSASQEAVEAVNWEHAFLSLANWALYGDGHATSHSPDEVSSLCRTAATQALRPPRRKVSFPFSHLVGEDK